MPLTQFGLDAQGTRQDEMLRALSGGPKSAVELCAALGVSPPTLSRSIQSAVEQVVMFRKPGQRTPLYGALRSSPRGVSASQEVYQIDRQGRVEQVGKLSLLTGGHTLVELQGGARLYDGLPPAVMFAAPSGFLGRQVAEAASAQLGVPKSIKDWSADHVASYLFALGADTPGNLVFGAGALDSLLAQRSVPPAPARGKLEFYRSCATSTIAHPVGSSAGGEQPKFTAEVEGIGHVIVKFQRAGTRMSDLLVLEELALHSLARAGLPAAECETVQYQDFMFLESRRFDRVGHEGRLGVLSAGAIDDEHFGQRDSWSNFAERCVRERMLTPEQALPVHVFAAFSELIGNNDTHFENVSLTLGDDGRLSAVAPAYDLSPMQYASLGKAMEPPLVPVTPSMRNVGARPQAWTLAFEAASDFWRRAGKDRRLTDGMRELAAHNLTAVTEFCRPLISQTAPSPAPASRRAKP